MCCIFPRITYQAPGSKLGKGSDSVKALSHDAIFHAACNAILLLTDVKLANTPFLHSLPIFNSFLTYQTFVTNLHQLRVDLLCKLQEKFLHVTVLVIELNLLAFKFTPFTSAMEHKNANKNVRLYVKDF